jgi:uroporphyrinogen decarboxylase
MNSRERTLLALNHQTPDRIPRDFWASPGMWRKLEAELGLTPDQFLDRCDIDLRYLAGPGYLGPPLDGVDIWGVPRVVSEVHFPGGVERYDEVARSPLASATTVDEILAYPHWPSPDWFDYTVIAQQCEDVHRQGRCVAFMGDRLNRVNQLKQATYLRGMEQTLLDLAADPELAHAVIGKIKSFYLAYLERLLDAANGGIDLLVTGDDFGVQNGLFISEKMWDTYLRAGFAAFIDLIHSYGVKVMHHSCGAVRPLIPRLITCGLDVLQSIQPDARGMVPAELKAEFGHTLAFQGGISVQRTMPFGTPEEIRAQVKRMAEVMGKGGGYIFCTAHNIQADTPVENVVVLVEGYGEFGL